ncbi:hypothetical protein [Frigidibacter sp. SD6-1]|uniref:hypothetical protein n=1 Tax=Frigidibacter sp. SD6-1 TaxID=3032581 RepID=UPI0024DFC1F3|nr:hypothetical protein [Frigidibacter sp. SD6-1]
MDEKPGKSEREPTREERRKAALRANLQRRKAQARARGDGQADAVGTGKKES